MKKITLVFIITIVFLAFFWLFFAKNVFNSNKENLGDAIIPDQNDKKSTSTLPVGGAGTSRPATQAK